MKVNNTSNVSSYIKKKLLNFFYYQRVVIYSYNLDKIQKVKKTSTDKTILEATINDIHLLFNDTLNTDLKNISLDLWREKITAGHWKGFLIKDGESIIAQTFYSVEKIFFSGTKSVELSLPKESAYGFKLFVRPDYRGRGLGQAVTSFRLESAKKNGIKKFYTAILNHNRVSRDIQKRVGGYYAGSVFFIKCRFFNWTLLSPGIHFKGINATSSTKK